MEKMNKKTKVFDDNIFCGTKIPDMPNLMSKDLKKNKEKWMKS